MATDKARITLYLPQDLKDRLAVIAEKDKRSVSVLIEILILEALLRSCTIINKPGKTGFLDEKSWLSS